MNSLAPSESILKHAPWSKCPVRRCPNLKPVGERLCDHHMGMQPPELVTRLADAFEHFVEVAKLDEIGVSMMALEAAFIIEWQIRIAIEKTEADNVAS